MHFLATGILSFFFIFSSMGYAQEVKNSTEKDYGHSTIYLPEQCYNGDPFYVAVKSQELKNVVFTWQKKIIALEPGKNGQLPGSCEAIFAVPLNSKAKSIPLKVSITTLSGRIEKVENIPVLQKKYPTQHLTVKQKYVTPSKAMQERISKEIKEQRAVYSVKSPVKYWSYPFERPISGKVTSLFGLRRFFNGQERNPHKGVDFNAEKGDPAYACDAGVVALIGNFYYNGNTVIIDHGLGVFTSYLHLSQINVVKGQKVSRGEVVGLVGSTGRVTGPHLHLGLSVLGKSVNAAQLINGMLE